MSKSLMRAAAAVAMIALAQPALSHGGGKHEAKADRPLSTDEKAFGREGDARKVSRTINVDMDDRMRFRPAGLTVKRGETIRFRIMNSGKVMHEMVLGTMEDLREHATHMKKHPHMEHSAANMAHVAPGRSAEMVWQFTKAGEVHFGCLVPGHFDAGMVGTIVVK